nr:energy transducer TonB [Hyphomonas sp. Mor2]
MRWFLGFCLILVSLSLNIKAKAQDLDVTEIVATSDAFAASPSDSTRAALLSALGAYSGEPTVQSVNAYIGLVMHDVQNQDNEATFESASAATAHLQPISDILPKQYIESRFVAAVAQFNTEQSPAAMLEMAHVKGFTRRHKDSLGERPDWAIDLGWKADAWDMAMEAFFESVREAYPSDGERRTIIDAYRTTEEEVVSRLSESGLPYCTGRMIQRPALRYPASKARNGKFGAVILGLELDADGQVINPTVLASVPVEEFDEKSLRVVGKWKFRPDDRNAVGVTCDLQRTNIVQPLVFQLR